MHVFSSCHRQSPHRLDPGTCAFAEAEPSAAAGSAGRVARRTLDALFATVAYVFVLDRYSFLEALQYIASGVIGESALAGGIATAALGVVLTWR